MKVLAWALLPALFLARGECDLAKVEKAFYCILCADVLTKAELVTDKDYFSCEDCGNVATKPGTCKDCGQPLTKQKSGKDVCGSCYQKPEACEVCVKEFFECVDCGKTSRTAGECGNCKTPMRNVTSRKLIEYVCSGCKEASLKPGKCKDDSCKRNGKELKKSCAGSGEFPHVK